MPRESGGGAQLPPTRLLLPRDRQCPLQFSFRLTFLIQSQLNLSPETIQLSFEKPFAGCFGQLNCLVQQIETDFGLTEIRVSRRDMAKKQSATVPFRVGLGCRASAAHNVDPCLEITSLRYERASKKTCSSVKACKFVLDTESDRFIGAGQGSSWITTYGAKNSDIGEPHGGRVSPPYRSGSSLGF